MIGVLLLLGSVLFSVLPQAVDCATESELPAKGRCFANATHWGDDFGIDILPPCWSASCRQANGIELLVLANPCSDRYDVEYSRLGQRILLLTHCYPSYHGELSGQQCCGGYRVCAHHGENKDYFNVINFFRFRNQIIYQPWFRNPYNTNNNNSNK